MPQWTPHIVHYNGWNQKLSHTCVTIHDLLCEKYHIIFVVFSCQCTSCNLAILNHKWPLMNKGLGVGYA